MTRTNQVGVEFVDLVPKTLQSGVLYVSQKYKTASHLCCCGCGSKVVTPLKPGGWQITVQRGAVTLYPSIGSWTLPCQSHYFIRGNQIVWAPTWSRDEIEEGRRNDQFAREQHFDSPPETGGILTALSRWLSNVFRRR